LLRWRRTFTEGVDHQDAMARIVAESGWSPRCVIQRIVATRFRASWPAISEERGQSFQAIVASATT
jgi:hypothetical protein